MKESNLWGRVRSFGKHSKMIVRSGLIAFVIIGGFALAFTLAHTHTAAHASGTITPGPVSST